MTLTNAHLRVARPTDKLAEVVKFYNDGLGFEVLYQFTDHDGFDGVMLGHKDAAYHLEFTRKTVMPPAKRRHKKIFWCSIYPIERFGSALLSGLRTAATNRSAHSTLIGIKTVKPSRTRTAIEWCFRIRAGRREKFAILWSGREETM
jgi:hypothetical protein